MRHRHRNRKVMLTTKPLRSGNRVTSLKSLHLTPGDARRPNKKLEWQRQALATNAKPTYCPSQKRPYLEKTRFKCAFPKTDVQNHPLRGKSKFCKLILPKKNNGAPTSGPQRGVRLKWVGFFSFRGWVAKTHSNERLFSCEKTRPKLCWALWRAASLWPSSSKWRPRASATPAGLLASLRNTPTMATLKRLVDIGTRNYCQKEHIDFQT